MNTTGFKAHLALLGTNLFFAINYSSIKYITQNKLALPFGLNLTRVIVAGTLFWSLYFFRRSGIRMRKKDFPRFLLCALTGIVINQLLFIKGLSFTWSIHGSLLMLTTPVIITFVAAYLLREKLSAYKLLGLCLALAGALVLVLSGESTGEAPNVVLGDVLILINAVSYSFYFILVKPLMKDYDPVYVLQMMFLIGLVIMAPIAWNEFREIRWEAFTGLAWMNLALLVIGGTFINYYLNIYGIKILGAGVAGTYIYTQPFMTTAIAMIFMGEKLEVYKILAGLLIFAGLIIESRSEKVSRL